ncbi:hypothetical protein GGS23DRAFT_36000 [Durotheca rogersii]|uniref:uncharacterized protein n=1 Tax=Durotheca rogersii TaxID=419775 RepID=UPI002220A5E9|nr:uncharacterized protein GGS23DRAFT_36000 [Durotheca rogersii]KAI5868548.1 hypothetical protein GGS23DRAFT_36000 [Durotheca rogersii]
MAFLKRLVPLIGVIALVGTPVSGQSVPIAFCAQILTATTPGNLSIYQSDGLCRDFCVGESAFAIVQFNQCWCSDYEPDSSTLVDVTDCDANCPGYPSDKCGADGLWGYMSLDRRPVGTTSIGSQTTTTAPPDSTPTASSTLAGTISTVTTGGIRETITIIPTVTDSPSAEPSDNSNEPVPSQQGLSTAGAVGIAVGVFGAVAIGVAVGVFYWLRRRRQQQEGGMADLPGSHRGSSAGMMGTPTTAMASVWDGDSGTNGRRNSRFMPHDPRMDPYAANIYSRFENKSHESVNTLQDNHDYSRKVLRTTNPDPPDAEQS